MSILDNTFINTFERAVSDDTNELQTLKNRMLAEFAKSIGYRKIIGGTPTQSIRTNVCMGLTITTNGSTFEMDEGVLMQQVASNPPDVPTPETLDSSYRIGLQIAPATISDPATANNRYWLLEARVVRTLSLTTNRDIFDPVTETFGSASVPKRYESQIETQWVEGSSTALPAITTGWAPIAGVFRPAGGGAITVDQITQLTTQIDDFTSVDSADDVVNRTSLRFKTNGDIDGTTTVNNGISFDLEAEIGGQKLFAKTDQDVSLKLESLVDPTYFGLMATPGYWWYVYLAPSELYVPSNAYGSTIEHRGLIIVSRVAPDLYGKNSGSLAIPNPFQGTILPGKAAFVGLFQSSAGVLYSFIDVTKSGSGMIDRVILTALNNGNGYQDGVNLGLDTAGVAGTEIVPYGCHYGLQLHHDVTDITSTDIGFHITIDDTLGKVSEPIYSSCRSPVSTCFDVPIRGDLQLTPNTNAVSTSGALNAVANCANNEYDLILYKIRLH